MGYFNKLGVDVALPRQDKGPRLIYPHIENQVTLYHKKKLKRILLVILKFAFPDGCIVDHQKCSIVIEITAEVVRPDVALSVANKLLNVLIGLLNRIKI